MTSKSELKVKYKELIRKKKKKEALKILKQIWGKKTKEKNISKAKPKKVVSKKKESLDNLSEINGIGKETVKDIKQIYNSISALKLALKKGRVPLRNDIVKKLSKHFF